MTKIEQVAAAIEGAQIGYSIRLTRLVDEVATYSLEYSDGGDPLEFPSHDEALEHVVVRERLLQARAAIEAMREPNEEMMEAVDCGGEKRAWLSGQSWAAGWRAMVDAAKLEP